MANQERVTVYIDGSNFYYKLRSPELSFPNLTKFNYRGLAVWLARDRLLTSCRYYVGVVRAGADNLKGQGLRSEQQRLFAHLSSQEQNFVIKRGYIMAQGGVYHEKGVDVQLAVDLLVGAYENLYDTAIIVSSDTDLIPAMKKILYLGKKVEYIGFAHQPSFAMQRSASLSRLLIKEDLEPLVIRTLV